MDGEFLNPYQPSIEHAAARPERSKQHSRLGIASLVVSLLSAAGMIAAVSALAAIMLSSRQRELDEDSVQALVLGFSFLGAIVGNFVALGLGIAGLVQRRRSRICAIAGLMIALAMLLVTIALFVLGSLE